MTYDEIESLSYSERLHIINRYGEAAFPGEGGDTVVCGDDAIGRVRNVVERLQAAGHPVVMDVTEEGDVTGIGVTVVQGGHEVPLFGFFLLPSGSDGTPHGVSLEKLHQRHRGALALLNKLD